MKLVVEVLDASDLKPKDGHGSASPYVEVEFDEQRQRTRVISRDLNPSWNESLVFTVGDPHRLPESTIDVSVYSDRASSTHRSFLGRVRLSGTSVAPSPSEASVQRCPLDKRGLFSNVRGEIALKVYADHGDPPPLKQDIPQIIQEAVAAVSDAAAVEPAKVDAAAEAEEEKKKKKAHKPREEERHVFHSIGGSDYRPVVSAAAAISPAAQPPVTVRAHHAKAEPAMAVMQIHGGASRPPGGQNPEFALVETRPPLAGRLGGDKISSTYDLVEQMYYLYVNVVKARDLPAMDVTGSLDPYVEVKLGNYKAVTRTVIKNQCPEWRQVFAFSKGRIQSNLLEVVVKDKDLVKDDFVGRVFFDLAEVPLRVPPDSPLAPQWYRLVDKKGGRSSCGEVMLGVWIGTQADEAFPDAWHSDAHGITTEGLAQTRSKVYFSPKLCYLRVHVIEAQDIVPTDRSRSSAIFVRLQLGGQSHDTRPVSAPTLNPVWNDERMFVASEPFNEPLFLSVNECVANGKAETLGRLLLDVSRLAIPRADPRVVEAKWYSLGKASAAAEGEEKKKENKFSSKIHLRLCLDAGYHVLDESTHCSSDLQPSARKLRKPSVGVLEVGILSARKLVPMKGGGRTDAYCVAKYGPKWVRTRTLLDTLHPQWNEQYTWEVFDPCTVVTIGVFDNCHVGSDNHQVEARDQRIGKVRIRLSTLEADRIYTHYYPLLVLHPSGLKKTGELHLAVRFTCTAWVNMISLYSRPLLPKMHYVQPIPVGEVDRLRREATVILSTRLARAEPPLRREVVEYMLDKDYNMWSLRRSKANFYRITSLLSCVMAVTRWYDSIRNWRNPVTTILVHVLFLILVCYPELILPTIFLYLFMFGLWNYRRRPRNPPHMDTKLSHADFAHPDELDEEFDTWPTNKPPEIVRVRYDRLRNVAGRVQTVVGDLATQGERAHALLSWRDPRATSIFVMLSLVLAVVLYVTPMQVIAVVVGIFLLRHPKFRSRMPSAPFNYYRRLPAKSDMML